MRSPSINTMSRVLGLTREDAAWLKKAMTIADTHQSVDDALSLANKLLHGHGVEAVTTTNYYGGYYQDIGLLYVNRGDTYTATICYDVEKDRFYAGTWGDWAEARPNIIK
jgi:hypothetical protein